MSKTNGYDSRLSHGIGCSLFINFKNGFISHNVLCWPAGFRLRWGAGSLGSILYSVFFAKSKAETTKPVGFLNRLQAGQAEKAGRDLLLRPARLGFGSAPITNPIADTSAEAAADALF